MFDWHMIHNYVTSVIGIISVSDMKFVFSVCFCPPLGGVSHLFSWRADSITLRSVSVLNCSYFCFGINFFRYIWLQLAGFLVLLVVAVLGTYHIQTLEVIVSWWIYVIHDHAVVVSSTFNCPDDYLVIYHVWSYQIKYNCLAVRWRLIGSY
jgi:hypothetical protein